jgi:hypothetical protein
LVGQAALFTGEEWKTSPWMFQAFRAVVSYLLERFTPPGEPIPPETAKQFGAKMGVLSDPLESMTPEVYGYVLSNLILTVLRTMPEPLPGMSVPSGSWAYAMPHAREALGIPWDVTETAEILARIAANTKEDTPP